jgi:hypothetical protein
MNVEMLMSNVKVPMGTKSSVILSVDVLPNIDGRVTGEWTGEDMEGSSQSLIRYYPGICLEDVKKPQVI